MIERLTRGISHILDTRYRARAPMITAHQPLVAEHVDIAANGLCRHGKITRHLLRRQKPFFPKLFEDFFMSSVQFQPCFLRLHNFFLLNIDLACHSARRIVPARNSLDESGTNKALRRLGSQRVAKHGQPKTAG